jgi:hypothetical protein
MKPREPAQGGALVEPGSRAATLAGVQDVVEVDLGQLGGCRPRHCERLPVASAVVRECLG